MATRRAARGGLRRPGRRPTSGGSYPHESIAALRDRGYFTAPIPEDLGGLGVASVHDLVVGASRLARADASVAIGVSMHLAVLGNLVRHHAMAVTAGAAGREHGPRRDAALR